MLKNKMMWHHQTPDMLTQRQTTNLSELVSCCKAAWEGTLARQHATLIMPYRKRLL